MSVHFPRVISTEMKHSVRRCLFEKPTAEKQEQEFEKMESRLFMQDTKSFREKWGLDPITGDIVSGAEYECVPVDVTQESIPSFYTKTYTRRKIRPAQSYCRERSHLGLSIVATRLNFDSPNRSFKRKFPFENNVQISDENVEKDFTESNKKRVPEEGDVVISSSESRSSSNSSSPLSSPVDEIGSPISLPMPSCLIHKSHLSSINSQSKDIISPRSTDLCTPQQRPRSLTQKTMKDYLPCKKPRCATKLLPRN